VPVSLEVRYARSFLVDLKRLEPAAYQRVYDFVFVEFAQKQQLSHLPDLNRLDADGILYRFSLGKYLIGIEVTGQIVKFIRVLPMPEI
jgi:mRNA-degrading endonuclease RelE of RelBE toxin-antitoxin system